jgi:pyocin large subunit-like protein
MGIGKEELSHTQGVRVSCGGRIQATLFLPGKLEQHYEDHAYKFNGDLSPNEYEERARIFVDRPVTKDILWFEDVQGVLYKYDKRKNEFGICKPDGAIITYYKPDDSIKYWHREVLKHVL